MTLNEIAKADLQLCAVPGDADDVLRTRVHPAPERPSRTAFQRDRERIVQARAFRRLAGKTQVFTSRASDHFRSRLTHTIEVMQIARSVADSLGLNQDLAETLALVHDIGHPPFGHAGERALDECLKRHGLRFDHNLHALRIVEHFEQRYAAHRGLNLTLGVREGIIKHSRDYDEEKHPDLASYLLGQRPPLEAQIIDLADEIAYLTADLDDGVESGLLEIDHIRGNVDILAHCYAQVEREHVGVEAKFLFNEALQLMQNVLTDDLIATTLKNTQAIGATTLEQVREYPARLATFSALAEAHRQQEKRYLYDTLYTCDALSLEHDKAEQVVTELFNFWINEPQELPSGYVEEIETEGRARVVADYIAGMTDSFILLQYAQVKTHHPALISGGAAFRAGIPVHPTRCIRKHKERPMNDISARVLRMLVMLVALPLGMIAQTTQQAGTLTIAGQQDQAPLVRVNGKSYVDLESLARITHGSIRFQGSQTILTLPSSGSATTAFAGQPAKTPQLSSGFLSTEIEALTQIREWRAALVNAIQNNYPVTDSWVSSLRRTAVAKMDLAVAAASTEPDQKSVELLRNEYTNMQLESDQFVAMHAKANYIAPDSFDNNALDQKILSCGRALVSMAATKQFQDEPSCH